jgi:hypothetical protein
LKCNFVLAATYDNYEKNAVVKCGGITDIPALVPKVTSIIITTIQIAVPVILVIMGMLDLAKGIMAQKEDEIKKGQQTFIKRAIAAVIVFFVIQIVQLLVGFISNGDTDVTQCFNCFVNGSLEKGCRDTSKEVDK